VKSEQIDLQFLLDKSTTPAAGQVEQHAGDIRLVEDEDLSNVAAPPVSSAISIELVDEDALGGRPQASGPEAHPATETAAEALQQSETHADEPFLVLEPHPQTAEERNPTLAALPEPPAREQDQARRRDAPSTSVEAFLKARSRDPKLKEKLARQAAERRKQRSKEQSRQKFSRPSLSLVSLFENLKFLGLDIGSTSSKYIQLKRTAGGYRLTACGSFRVPEIPFDANEAEKVKVLAEGLTQGLEPKWYKNALVTTAVSGLEVVFKNVRVPKLKKKELDKAVPWACRKDFPFPIESMRFEYFLLNRDKTADDSKVDAFVVAAQKKLLASHVEVLQKAHITPNKISTIPTALWRLFQERKKDNANSCLMVVDIGAGASHIVFINKNQLQFARQISTGSNDFTDVLTGDVFLNGQDLNFAKAQADAIKQKYGIPQDDGSDATTEDGIPLKEIAVMMGPVVERLVSELQRTVEFYKEKFDVDAITQIYLTGGGALMPNLAAVLTQELAADVRVLNPFEFVHFKRTEIPAKLHRCGPQFAVAVGLALDRNKDLNLIPEELKGSQTLVYVKRIFKYFFLISILLMVMLSQNLMRQFEKTQEEFKRLNSEYLASQPKRKRFLSLQKQLANLTTRKKRIIGVVHVDLSAANHLKAISHLVPPQIALTNVQLTEVTRSSDIDPKDKRQQKLLNLIGVAFEQNSMEGVNLAKFMLALDRSGYFYSIRLKSQKIRKDGSMAFTIECEL